MLRNLFLSITLLALSAPNVASFLPQQRVNSQILNQGETQSQHQPFASPNHPSQQAIFRIPRGGSAMKLSPSSVIPTIISTLQTGPAGILALSAVTWSVVLPLTLYKKIYGIGVAYGFSVAAAGLAMLNVFSSAPSNAICLAKACIFYGVRLGSYLLLRDYLRDYQTTVKNGSISSRVTFSASLAIFYALLTTPVLYALRSSTGGAVDGTLGTVGAYLAWSGAGLEAVADLHKLIVKQKSASGDGNEFTGPDTWTYRICRHPNYLGEMLFWIGLFVGGVGSFGKSIPAWLGSSFGLVGILSIMLKAASGLEKRHQEKYQGQERYDAWKSKAKYSLIPFIQ